MATVRPADRTGDATLEEAAWSIEARNADPWLSRAVEACGGNGLHALQLCDRCTRYEIAVLWRLAIAHSEAAYDDVGGP